MWLRRWDIKTSFTSAARSVLLPAFALRIISISSSGEPFELPTPSLIPFLMLFACSPNHIFLQLPRPVRLPSSTLLHKLIQLLPFSAVWNCPELWSNVRFEYIPVLPIQWEGYWSRNPSGWPGDRKAELPENGCLWLLLTYKTGEIRRASSRCSLYLLTMIPLAGQTVIPCWSGSSPGTGKNPTGRP